ncbi:MAG: helix-hairpin-helix domain-containing protein [Anaerolineaceae bacterium]|nr:helix-hairpin-helix domain-containing protein [Anaerolineaceae bacterium]
MKPWQNILLGSLLTLLAIGAIYLVSSQPRGEPIQLPTSPPPLPMKVYVTGAVTNPGVYSIPRLSRVENVIQAAGGFLKTADTQNINLASKLIDGEEIIVPTIGQALTTTIPLAQSPSPKTTLSSPSSDNPLDINTATAEQLDGLPGIGTSKAQQIIAFRQQNGPFQKIEDLQNVPGIGPGIFTKIKDMITVNN